MLVVSYLQLTGNLPVKLPVTYRPLLARLGHLALVLKGVGQSLGLEYLYSNLIITQ